MKPRPATEHRQLCTIELIAEGHGERCAGEECAFWDRGCALSRVEHELDRRPEVAQILLDLRRELEAGREIALEAVRSRFAHVLNEDEDILGVREERTTLARAPEPAAEPGRR